MVVVEDPGRPKTRPMAARELAIKRPRWEIFCAAFVPAGFPGVKVWAGAALTARTRQTSTRGARGMGEG